VFDTLYPPSEVHYMVAAVVGFEGLMDR